MKLQFSKPDFDAGDMLQKHFGRENAQQSLGKERYRKT